MSMHITLVLTNAYNIVHKSNGSRLWVFLGWCGRYIHV